LSSCLLFLFSSLDWRLFSPSFSPLIFPYSIIFQSLVFLFTVCPCGRVTVPAKMFVRCWATEKWSDKATTMINSQGFPLLRKKIQQYIDRDDWEKN
jgi:hypothetical protein